jgi:hypothetical protein
VSTSWLGHAQTNTGGAWMGVGAKKELSDKFDLKGGLEFRTLGGFTDYQTTFSELGVQYKVMEGLDAEVNYRLGYRRNDENFIWRQRFNVDLNYEYDFGKPELDFRVRYQFARAGVAVDEDGPPELNDAFRYRLRGSTEVVDDLDVDLSYELFQSRDERGFSLSDWRLRLQFSKKISKKQDLTFGYLIQRQMNRANPDTEHIFTVGYSFEL